MPYITTNHRFIIDEKHPADVFEEMENFFSLYTVEITDLQQVSIQLNVPATFAINDNKKLAESYRQFIQAIKYTVPDANILPITTQANDSENDGDEETANTYHNNTVILLIQRYDGVVVDEVEDARPSLYQRTLGRLLPKFGSETSDDGLYPEQQPVNIAIPTLTPPPVAAPVPTPSYIPPVAQPVPQPVPVAVPVHQPTPVVQPNFQPQYQPPVTQPQVTQAVPVAPATPKPTATRLTNINQSVKPYQDILTQAIVQEATRQQAQLNAPLTNITLKSSDSLTTAMIEQLFHSFAQAGTDKSQTAHDAIDLVSYGYEILKPALAQMGVTLADNAQFGLKTNAKSTAADIERLKSGGVFANEINLRVKLATASTPQATTIQPTPQTLQTAQVNSPNLNANSQNIALLLKISDPLGERQQKASQFPLNFVSSDSPSQPHNVRLFGQAGQGSYCSIVELDGQVMLDNIANNVTVSRNGQPLYQGTTLMPKDILTIQTAKDSMTIQLLLAN